jgi:hypothetical protein
MSRYFFDLRHDGSFMRDDDGVELGSLAAARSEVMKSLPAIASHAIRKNGEKANFEMTVRDAAGSAVMNATLSFAFRRL